jgi:predicted branched-subunit amino acid permease
MTSEIAGDIRDGVRCSLAVLLSAAPFGILFGAVAVDNGLTTAEAVMMSAALFAGASQLVGVELFGHHVAPWLIVLSIFAVNFRHVLYSAAIARYIRHFTLWQKCAVFFLLIDPLFAEGERRGDAGRPVGPAWYFAFGLSFYVPWLVLTFVGCLLGNLIGDPQTIGIDVLLPIYFMGLVFGFRGRANWLPIVLASAAGSILALQFVGSPWHVSIGALTGVLVAALMPLNDGEDEQTAAAPVEGEA